MGTLYKNTILNNIVALGEACTPKVSPSKMCTDLGLSRSLVTKLKDNPERTINGGTAQKIADYFGVSVDCVLGSEQKEKPTLQMESELSGVKQEIWELINTMSDEKLEKVLGFLRAAAEV